MSISAEPSQNKSQRNLLVRHLCIFWCLFFKVVVFKSHLKCFIHQMVSIKDILPSTLSFRGSTLRVPWAATRLTAYRSSYINIIIWTLHFDDVHYLLHLFNIIALLLAPVNLKYDWIANLYLSCTRMNCRLILERKNIDKAACTINRSRVQYL